MLRDIEDEEEGEKGFKQWFRDFAVASRELDEARGLIRKPVAARIQSAILKRLDVEGPMVVPPSSAEGGGTFPQNPESSAIFRKLVFLKYGITFPELIRKVDIERNPAAHRMLMAVHRDYWRMKSGVEFKDFRLKFSMDHFDIMVQGFDFGLQKLSADELAECLDNICRCGLRHSPEYTKKLRTRIKRACVRLIAND